MQRVLIFSLTYHPFVGGAEVAIKEITDRLGAEKYEFHMVTLRFDSALPRKEMVGNVLVHRIGFAVRGARVSDRAMPALVRFAKLLFPFTSLVKAIQLHATYRYDLIWAMMANHAGFGALFFKLTHPSIPYVLELQDGRAIVDMGARRPILKPLWSLYRLVYMRADAMKAISNFIAGEVRSLGYRGRLEVIPNAVDVARFSAPASEEAIVDIKNRYGKRIGDVFLFTASRLVLSRGVEDTIRALSFLPKNVKLLIAGDGEDKKKLERIATDARVQERVIFAGHVPHDELPLYYKVSDIFVRPSLIEGFGNSFVEAFAAGVPVVATEVGGIPDFLFDPEKNPDRPATGLFCEVQNPESIARVVTRYMENPALVSEVVQHARALVKEKYDWSIISKSMQHKIFEPLMKRG